MVLIIIIIILLAVTAPDRVTCIYSKNTLMYLHNWNILSKLSCSNAAESVAVLGYAGPSQNPALVKSVAMALTSLWARHAKSPRLATPALRTAEVLLSRTQILSSAGDHSDLAGKATTQWSD